MMQAFTQSTLKKATFLSLLPLTTWAADSAAPTAGMSILKMFLGLAVVLVVMGLFTWGAKKMLPGMGAQASSVKMIGGISVGTRERVVVLEIAGRWIVVGVGGGQVSAIANLEPGALAADSVLNGQMTQTPLDKTLQPFTQWLSQAMNKKSSEK
ncbi:MAG TPA: flagellar biosynthetic protein FliO [Methylophilus sp.]